jgi:hypothetical protein
MLELTSLRDEIRAQLHVPLDSSPQQSKLGANLLVYTLPIRLRLESRIVARNTPLAINFREGNSLSKADTWLRDSTIVTA